MSNRIYCTYFDHNYLSRGLALYYSLQRHAPSARLWVLCLSETCHQILVSLDLPELVPVRLEDFEETDPQLAATKSTRSTVEYYFTCSPAWLLYVTERERDAEWVTYLDGDLYFFASPEVLYNELVDATVAIVPHRFAPNLRKRHVFGTYNVGWVGVRNDPDGISVIRWWRERCIEWCYDQVDGDRYADQGYLSSFSRLSAGVRVIQHVGANLAPWNIANHRIGVDGGQVVIDGIHPLIFFHFQGLRTGFRWFLFNSHRIFGAPFSWVTRQHIYRPYIDEMLAVDKLIGPLQEIEKTRPQVRSHTVKSRLRDIALLVFHLLDIVSGRAFLVLHGTAY
jgi:YHS domain-containing protein